MSNYKPIPPTADKEFWGDAVHDTVDTSKLPLPHIDVTNVRRRGPYLMIDGGDSGIAVDWRKLRIDKGRLTHK